MSIGPIIDFAKNKFKNNKINVIEIGAMYGDSSEIILNNFNINKYYIIDPYIVYEEYNQDGFNKILKGRNDAIFYKIKNKLNAINDNVIFYRNKSNDTKIIDSFDNDTIDFIFIDGNHTYKYVLEDLENYSPKLKKNGILCGDDFFMRSHSNDILNSGAGYNEPMVYEAVTDFCIKYNKTYTEFGSHRNYGKLFMIDN